MRFIVANYGTRHVGMLLAHLYSIARTHPDAAIAVYWQDIPEPQVRALRVVAPRAEFIPTAFDFAQDPLQRISSKVLCWARAAAEFAGERELVFCDSDTLIRKPLGEFFPHNPGDVIVTEKPEKVPLNSGVILARGGSAATAFFAKWREETLHILQTPELFAQANDGNLPYGGTDQMSLFRMLPYAKGTVQYRVDCDGQDALVAMERCARLNETNSRALHDEIHVIHYKAGWQRILLDGRPFSRFRPRKESWEMLGYFLETFREALARVNQQLGKHYKPADFGIRWPWYYQNGRWNAPAYLAWRAREAGKRAWLLVTGKLKPGM